MVFLEGPSLAEASVFFVAIRTLFPSVIIASSDRYREQQCSN